MLERIGRGTDDYAPGNLPPRIGVAFAPTGNPAKDAAAAERAVRVQLAFSESFKNGGSLISRVPRALSVGYWWSWLYVATSVAVVLAATSTADLQSWPKISRETLVQALNPAALIERVGDDAQALVALVVGLVTSPIVTVSAVAAELWQAPALLATLPRRFRRGVHPVEAGRRLDERRVHRLLAPGAGPAPQGAERRARGTRRQATWAGD